MLTKYATLEDTRGSKSKPSAQARPPPNMPVAPPPKDPLDDTLRGVKSLNVELSGKAPKLKKREKQK
ncbi:unnamed protein product [Nippostrongylus brasiliensis]|uniref:Uncharacterized protein n=1 Tax=Nippostrongylus brasiliensis TaxID=27835 RepID=A0A0N4YMC3_NIPBR|nr:unnamed protein product [Nippostrongylus brasiliensis]